MEGFFLCVERALAMPVGPFACVRGAEGGSEGAREPGWAHRQLSPGPARG